MQYSSRRSLRSATRAITLGSGAVAALESWTPSHAAAQTTPPSASPAAAPTLGGTERFVVGAGGAAGSAGLGTGVHLMTGVRVLTPSRAVVARADAAFSTWPRRGDVGSRQRVGALTFGAEVHPWRGRDAFTPYLLAGVGAYATGSGGGVAPGATAGVGVSGRVAGIRPFAELRVHTWRPRTEGAAARRLTPLVVGLRF